MLRRAIKLLFIFLFVTTLYAQRERQIPPPEEGDFGSKFFDQLRSIFGKFRDSDLQRVFQLAEPIQCSELVSGKGEWREVAFFNEKRSLGEWYRSNIEEVRSDVSVYLFKGSCRELHSTIQVITKFPVGDSIDDYNSGKIPFNDIDINVNAAVNVTFDPRSGAYAFDLPYLYLIGHQGTVSTYSLIPPHFGDRYATDVSNPWDCKAVRSLDITYRFLICRTATMQRGSPARGQTQARNTPEFGSNAYFILSDGAEAHSSVRMALDDTDVPRAAPSTPAAPASAPDGAVGWQAPSYRSHLVDVDKSEFRIRFFPDTWKDRIGSTQVMSNQRVASLQTAKPQDGADYCVWTPGVSDMVSRLMSDEPDKDVSFSVLSSDRVGGQPTASISFVMKTHTGVRLGTLQCFFPRTDSADGVGYDRWSYIAGGQVKLEVRP